MKSWKVNLGCFQSWGQLAVWNENNTHSCFTFWPFPELFLSVTVETDEYLTSISLHGNDELPCLSVSMELHCCHGDPGRRGCSGIKDKSDKNDGMTAVKQWVPPDTCDSSLSPTGTCDCLLSLTGTTNIFLNQKFPELEIPRLIYCWNLSIKKMFVLYQVLYQVNLFCQSICFVMYIKPIFTRNKN